MSSRGISEVKRKGKVSKQHYTGMVKQDGEKYYSSIAEVINMKDYGNTINKEKKK